MRNSSFTATAVIMCLSFPALAQQTTSAPTTAPTGIAALLEEETVAVLVVDLDKIDFKALNELVAKFSDGPGGAAEVGLKRFSEYRDAKAGRFIASINFLDITRGIMPTAVMPRKGTDLEPLRKLLAKMDDPVGTGNEPQTKMIGDLLVHAHAAVLKRINENVAKRPDLEKALAAGGEGALTIAFAMPDSLKATIAELMPTLPKELGGGDSAALSEGLQWGVITIQSPPKLAARCVVQAKDKATADKLKAVWMLAMKHVIEVQMKNLPEMGGKDVFDKIVATLTPQIKDNQVTLDLSPEQTEFLVQKVLVPEIKSERAIEEAMRRQAASGPTTTSAPCK